MDIKSEKLNIIQQLLQVEDELILQAVQRILDIDAEKQGDASADFWEELTESQLQQIELSRSQHQAGEGISHDQVMEEFRKKYGS